MANLISGFFSSGAATDITASAAADTASTMAFDAMSSGAATAVDASAGIAPVAGDMLTTGTAADAAFADISGVAPSASSIASTLSGAAGLGSMILKGTGQVNQARANSEAATFNANIADMNASLATQQSQWIGQTANQQVQKSQLETRDLVGATAVNQAASGVEIGSKTATDVRASEAAMGATNAMNIRASASRLAYGQEVTAAGDTAQASLLRSQAGQDITAGQVSAGTTVLGSLANPANNYVSQAISNSLTGS